MGMNKCEDCLFYSIKFKSKKGDYLKKCKHLTWLKDMQSIPKELQKVGCPVFIDKKQHIDEMLAWKRTIAVREETEKAEKVAVKDLNDLRLDGYKKEDNTPSNY